MVSDLFPDIYVIWYVFHYMLFQRWVWEEKQISWIKNEMHILYETT